MQSIYTIYKCKHCNGDMILPTDRVNKNIKNNKYLVCAYCSSKDLKKGKETDGLIEALRNDERVK